MKKISIIIPVYNAAQYIQECIESVLEQNYSEKELIIIDGGSSDGTVEIIKKYEQYLSYWITEKDDGQTFAINKGLKQSTGDIMAWINADERYLPGAFEKIVDAFEKNGDIELVYGYTNMTNEDDSFSFIRKPAFKNPKFQTLVLGGPLQTDALFWTRSIFERIGYLDQENYPRLAMDLEWSVRLAHYCKKWCVLELPLSMRIERLDASTNSTPYKELRGMRISIISDFLLKRYKIPLRFSRIFSPFITKIAQLLNVQYHRNCNGIKKLNASKHSQLK